MWRSSMSVELRQLPSRSISPIPQLAKAPTWDSSRLQAILGAAGVIIPSNGQVKPSFDANLTLDHGAKGVHQIL